MDAHGRVSSETPPSSGVFYLKVFMYLLKKTTIHIYNFFVFHFRLFRLLHGEEMLYTLTDTEL